MIYVYQLLLLALSCLWFSSLPLPFSDGFCVKYFSVKHSLGFPVVSSTVSYSPHTHLSALQLSAQSGSWRVRIKFFYFFIFSMFVFHPQLSSSLLTGTTGELTPGYPSSLVVDLFCLSLDSGWQEFTIVQLQPQFRQILYVQPHGEQDRRIFSAFFSPCVLNNVLDQCWSLPCIP